MSKHLFELLDSQVKALKASDPLTDARSQVVVNIINIVNDISVETE
jgi:hypothetical protein